MADEYTRQLDRMAPEARKRIEEILKSAIERELAGSAVNASDLASKAKEFSKGWFFSRSRPSAFMRPEEEMILQSAATLDDAAFSRFAERLSSLKAMKDK